MSSKGGDFIQSRITIRLRIACSEILCRNLKNKGFKLYFKKLSTDTYLKYKFRSGPEITDEDFEIVAIYNGDKTLDQMDLTQSKIQQNIACKKIAATSTEK